MLMDDSLITDPFIYSCFPSSIHFKKCTEFGTVLRTRYSSDSNIAYTLKETKT